MTTTSSTGSSSSSFDSTLASLGIQNYGSTSNTSSTGTTGSSTLGSSSLTQADFLQLLTAQMQNQDPFQPVDNTQMVAQMAQFSSLQGITDMNTTLTSIANKLSGTSLNDALNYVGKNVLTPGSTAYPNSSGGIEGAVDVGADASDVTVTIQDANGATLKTLDLGAQSAGTIDYSWDGTTDSGASAGSGPFTIKASAVNASGAVTANPLVWAPVESVGLDSSGSPVLNAYGLGQVSLSDVREIG